ncbi:protein kinase domain-containing protein [Streptomyces capparidis]
MGVVYLAHSPSGRQVAVKVVHKHLAADPEFRARFQQEVAAARRVSGAFTAPVLDADADAVRPWMATLYVPGMTLAERVKKEGPLRGEELWQLATGLSEALRDIHRAGVVHRDLKPGNVLLAEDGPKVIDFGISRPHDSALRTETGKVIGTPPFMAPEQFRAPREVGTAADVFAFGCLLAHAAQGRGPFDSDSPYIVAYQVVHDEPNLDEVPDELRPLVRRCLAKDPAERPEAGELMRALRQARGPGEPTVPFSEGGAARTPALGGPGRDEPGPVQAGDGDGGPGAAAAGAGRRRWRRPSLIGVLVAAVLAAGGYVGAQELGSSGPSGRPPVGQTAGASNEAWEDVWETRVGRPPSGPDEGRVHAAKCVPTAEALYCAGTGVAASRIDAADGRVWWKERAPWADRWVQAPGFAGGLVQMPEPGEALRALDPESGRERWSVPLSGASCCWYAGDTVLLLDQGRATVRALDGARGTVRWEKRFTGHPDPRLVTLGNRLFLVDPDPEHNAWTRVSEVRPDTGRTLWQRRFSGVVHPAAVSGGTLYLLEDRPTTTDTHAVLRYEPDSGATVRTALPYPAADAGATAAGGTVYLLDATGMLMAVDTRARAVRWELETAVNNPSPPVAAGERVYLSSPNGQLLSVDARRGVLLKQTQPRFDRDLRGTLEVPVPIVTRERIYAFTPRGSVFSVAVRDMGK